jgi:hypothetical protein
MPRAGTVWLLGETLERWDGYRFQVLPKVLAKGDAAVAAAGATEQEAWLLVRQGSEAFLLHPDGKKWSRLRVPFRADGALLRADASGLWVAVDGKLFHRTQTGWESPSAEGVAALAPSSSEAWLAGGPTAVWTSDERGIQPLPPVHGRVAAVWGVGSTDLWVGGSRGLLRHFDGKGWKGSDAVTLEPLISVGGTGGNDVWALGPDGEVLRRRGGEWSPSPHVPPEAGRAAQLWVGAGETWVAAANGCYRWSASAWTKVPGIGAAQAVWSRSPKDVWIAGKALFHWDGKQVKLVVEAPVGALFADVTGTVDRVWAILRGPRPEYAGGKSTGEPDDVVEVNGEQVARLGYPSRPTRLAVLKGKLWAVDTQLRRFEGDGWIPTRPAFGTAVDVAGTLLTLTPDGFAWARGRSGGQVSIPLGSLSDLWTDGQRAAWAVGSDGLIVRIHAAALK